ncbi:MAG TPA: TolC family outer membrane protein, partial [Rubrivivax sp.]|nr:TolC family outer membrane protein [Rubrivivax sp.]
LGRPAVTLSATVGNAQRDTPATDRRSTTSATGTVNGRYPLFNRSNEATIEQARRSLASAQADLDTAEQDLLVRLSLAYFDVLAAQDTVATTRASLSAITEQLASARRNFEVGTATITDTREAQARFDLAGAQELAADNDLRAKRIGLDQLVGRTGVQPRPLLVPVVLPSGLGAPGSVEEWVTLADQQHPNVRRARVALEVAQLETTKARAGRLPTVDAVASVSGRDDRGSAFRNTNLAGRTVEGQVGVQMAWSLYSGGAVQARIQETQLLEERSRNDLEAARRGIAQTTRVAYFNVLSGQAQVKALEAAESSSKLALEATQLGYRVGVRVNLDVLNAQTQLFNAQQALARARYDVLLGGLRLRQAAGQLAPTDILAVNRLLAP